MAPEHGAQHEWRRTDLTSGGGLQEEMYPSSRRFLRRSDAAMAQVGAVGGSLAPSL